MIIFLSILAILGLILALSLCRTASPQTDAERAVEDAAQMDALK